MKKYIFISLLITALFTLNGCKKYEENPLVNLSTKKYRLIQATRTDYQTVGYWIDGNDSINTLAYRGYIRFTEIEGENIINCFFFGGHWEFVDHKKYLRIRMSNISSPQLKYGPFITNEMIDWRITKLTNRELHLKTGYHGKQYVVHLHKLQ